MRNVKLVLYCSQRFMWKLRGGGGGLGISELFDGEDRDETGNFVVQIDRVIAAALRVTDVEEGSEVKAVLDIGVGDKGWKTTEEIPSDGLLD